MPVFLFRVFFSSRVLSRQLTKVRTPKKIKIGGMFCQSNINVEESSGLPIGTFMAAAPADFTSSETPDARASPYAATGAASCITANRLAYVFGLVGPSMTVDTACSFSLVPMDAAPRVCV